MPRCVAPTSFGADLAGTSTGPNSARVTLKSMKRDDQLTTILPTVALAGCSLYNEMTACASIGEPRDGAGEPMRPRFSKLTQYSSEEVLTHIWVPNECGSSV